LHRGISNMKKSLISYLSLLLLSLTACTQSNPSTQIVESYLDAYNEHDIEAMLEYLADDAKWMSVSEARVTIETSNNEQLKTVLEAYFEDLPSTRSEIQHVAANGNFINAFEKAIWEDKDGDEQSQCAASVYELEEGLIKNIWYYPSSKCETH